MKRAVFVFTAIALCFLMSRDSSSEAPKKFLRKIIVWKAEMTDMSRKDAFYAKTDLVKLDDLPLVNGEVVMVAEGSVKDLEGNPDIAMVDDDYERHLLSDDPVPPADDQTIPWGIERVGAPKVWERTKGAKIKVAVMDTGIDRKHPDLIGNYKGGYNTFNRRLYPSDDHGHGTHVAGTVAASFNYIGVVGVAPEVELYAVKVLNFLGSGNDSNLIKGFDWAIKNEMDVVNLSLGDEQDSPILHEAFKKAYDEGIVIVAAAGNSYGGKVDYPGAWDEVICVSSIDKNNTVAKSSSVGPEVDVCAPGDDIFSTYKGKTYTTMSGTSMASPHVAGAAALLISMPQTCDKDGDGTVTPEEVKARLVETAKDLGDPGRDDKYGAGLIDLEAALKN